MKRILAIVGSASKNSSNLRLVHRIGEFSRTDFDLEIFDSLTTLPHFDPELSVNNTPADIIQFRELVLQADGIIICTPEYIFSIPSCLKNVIEWCVSTTVFSHKPVGLITASAHGQKGHEELKLIMGTVESVFTEGTTLLIQGIKGKIDENGNISDAKTRSDLANFIAAFNELTEKSAGRNIHDDL